MVHSLHLLMALETDLMATLLDKQLKLTKLREENIGVILS